VCRWLSAFCIYVVVDVIHPQPPDGVLDWIVTDIAIVILAASVAIALWLVLWACLTFVPRRSAVWYGALLICCGALIGWSFAYLFSSIGSVVMRAPKDPFLPSAINFGSLAGAAAFAAGYLLTRFTSSNQSLQPR
jgi:hypothetical protein